MNLSGVASFSDPASVTCAWGEVGNEAKSGAHGPFSLNPKL